MGIDKASVRILLKGWRLELLSITFSLLEGKNCTLKRAN